MQRKIKKLGNRLLIQIMPLATVTNAGSMCPGKHQNVIKLSQAFPAAFPGFPSGFSLKSLLFPFPPLPFPFWPFRPFCLPLPLPFFGLFFLSGSGWLGLPAQTRERQTFWWKWVWGKKKCWGDHRFWSMFPFYCLPLIFWVPIVEPNPRTEF